MRASSPQAFTVLLLAALLASCASLNRALGVEQAPAGVSPLGFGWPIDGFVSSPFGLRTLGGRTRVHKGVDFTGGWLTTPVFATAPGVIRTSEYSRSYGHWIEIQHDGHLTSRYAHLSVKHVDVGEHVERGDLIGRVGASGSTTGSHLHFEIRLHDAPLDPLELLPQVPVEVRPRAIVVDTGAR